MHDEQDENDARRLLGHLSLRELDHPSWFGNFPGEHEFRRVSCAQKKIALRE